MQNLYKSSWVSKLFLPIVHTKDKKENPIEKLACSEFWKAKDKLIEEVEKYKSERDKIIADNKELNNTVKILEKEYKKKRITI